jgi:hypothetical protein
LERIAYGIARMEAHAIPTPTITSSSRYWFWMK